MKPDQKIDTSSFDLIWQRFPERLNRQSSTWWYFLLLPKQAEGYGPKQLMFSLVSVVGDTCKLNHVEHPGMSLHDAEDTFNNIALGWIFDGQQMHENIVHQSGQATLSLQGSIAMWAAQNNGQQHGGEIIKVTDGKPFEMKAAFSGDRGGARFNAWGDSASKITTPEEIAVYTNLGGIHAVVWRQFQFAGEFSSPFGSEHLEGIGYFQRVCYDIPFIPWKWAWATFEDQSIFSSLMFYLGPQIARSGDWFFPNMIERATIPLRASSYFYDASTGKTTKFNQVRITPSINGKLPQFTVECRSANGDFIRYKAMPYAHAQFLWEKPILNSRWYSCFNYNDYPFRVKNLAGSIGGRPLNIKAMGNGFGSLEYTWGLGIR